MNNNTLWSLRLGFSNKQSKSIENLGLSKFLEQSFATKFDASIPEFLLDSPKSYEDFKALRKERKENPDERKDLLRKEVKTSNEMRVWWVNKMIEEEFPLREKMTCFWHNHYVSTFQKVKVNRWLFSNNQILRENAFGNFKDLTKKIIKTNAMVRYLDNNDNKKGKLNENLSRELLELFTLGIGNYTEQDIKNGAKGLAGLSMGEENAIYRPKFEDDEAFEYLGKKGNFKIDEMIDIIFDQPNVPYLLCRKILKWFIYDNPKEELVKYYGDYFKKQNFEIKPLLTKLFTEEFSKQSAGSKIKNPLEFALQLIDELNLKNSNLRPIVYFIKEQGMDLFNQPNVKGWDGGNSWLTSQVYLQRNKISDLLCSGKGFSRRKEVSENPEMKMETENKAPKTTLNWNKSGNNKQIISELKERVLFSVDENTQLDFEKILKYDFDPNTDGSENAVLRLFNAMTKTPEFQLI